MSRGDQPVLPAEVRETHISILFFVGDRAYKLKKPVRFDFVDLSSRERRERACHREVELNRRLAPDVYLGVLDVMDPAGEPVDHLVAMRRMPAERRLSALVAASSRHTTPCLAAVAAQLADFHARALRSPAIDAEASRDAIAALWRVNFDVLERFRGALLDPETVERCRTMAEAFLAGRERLFTERVNNGFVCDGHGDLQADDIFYLDDGPRILDCLEFDDTLRYGDVANDIAFLAMDLERLSDPATARTFVHLYERASGVEIPRTLLHFYIAYRAQVRTKVMCLRWSQSDPSSAPAGQAAEAARQLLALCDRHLTAATVRLILVGGLPGTGKSTLSRELGRRLGATVLRSDQLRSELDTGDDDGGGAAGYGEGRYAPEATAAVYRLLLERARPLLELGMPVLIDASWSDARHRAAAMALARDTAAEVGELCCVLDPTIAARRIEARLARGKDLSEATPAIARQMATAADPWPTAHTILTDKPIAACVDEAEEALRGHGAHDRRSAYARCRDPQPNRAARGSQAAPRTEMEGEAVMPRVQPADEWEFLPRDDDLDDDGESVDPAPESAAIHVQEPWSLTPAEDPGRAEVDLSLDGVDGEDDDVPVSYFEDEQPEVGRLATPVRTEEAEPDLEELLESQHYAFAPEPGDSV